MKIAEMVKTYAEVAGQKPSSGLMRLLIEEEFGEWLDSYLGVWDFTPAEELKELADLVYVIYGYANVMGFDLDEAVRRVHINNMERMTQDDGTILKREDGKIIKNPNTPKVDLEDLVNG